MSFPENRNAKPPYSYAALICLALATSQQRMTLNQIYNWVRGKFAFFRFGDQSWTVSYMLIEFLSLTMFCLESNMPINAEAVTPINVKIALYPLSELLIFGF